MAQTSMFSKSAAGAACATLCFIGMTVAPLTFAKVEQQEDQGSSCSLAKVETTYGAGALRRLVDDCKDRADVALKALAKLNALPLPVDKVIQLEPGKSGTGAQSGLVEHASFEISVFFGTGESYPTEDGLGAMSELVTRVNATHGAVKSVAIVGSVDAAEAETSLARSLARGRAEILHRYLVAAGVDKGRIQAAIKTRPSRMATAPADRAAHVAIIVELPVTPVVSSGRTR